MAGTDNMPSTKDMIGEARKTIMKSDPEMLRSKSIRKNFSDVVEAVFDATYEAYKRHEAKTVAAYKDGLIGDPDKMTFTRAEVNKLLDTGVSGAITLEKSLKQSRSSRAGKTFEVIVQDLLADIGISSERVTSEDRKSKLRRIDLVVPDRRTAIDSPDQAHFLSLKTSLRERWNQVVAEQTQGQRTYLLTLLQKETISNANVERITQRGIFLYVPDRVKKDRFMSNKRVRGLSDLPSALS